MGEEYDIYGFVSRYYPIMRRRSKTMVQIKRDFTSANRTRMEVPLKRRAYVMAKIK